MEAAKRRHEEAIKARNEPPVPRSKYLEKRARYYELFSTYHLKCILGKCSESEKQDDEIAVIQMVLKNKLQTAQDQSNSEE
ncbi:hypothetical protein SAMN04488490_0905 [Marinobacter sp. LV10R510-11A]|nr:hypothetical protein SAMN04488490_0905 [Marinobacter sp. LV10R510-11A]